jgi:hypothetical protein
MRKEAGELAIWIENDNKWSVEGAALSAIPPTLTL